MSRNGHGPRGLSTNPHLLETAGLRANRTRDFTLTLRGEQFYDVLDLLDAIALEGDSYSRVRDAVVWAEEIRRQLAAQGF